MSSDLHIDTVYIQVHFRLDTAEGSIKTLLGIKAFAIDFIGTLVLVPCSASRMNSYII